MLSFLKVVFILKSVVFWDLLFLKKIVYWNVLFFKYVVFLFFLWLLLSIVFKYLLFFEICCFLEAVVFWKMLLLEICCCWNLFFKIYCFLESVVFEICFLKSVVFWNLLFFEICCFWNLLFFKSVAHSIYCLFKLLLFVDCQKVDETPRKIKPVSAIDLALWYSLNFWLVLLLTLLHFRPFSNDRSAIPQTFNCTPLHPEIPPSQTRNCHWLYLSKIPNQHHLNKNPPELLLFNTNKAKGVDTCYF